MLFQDRVIEALKCGQSMTIKGLRSHIESTGVKAAYGAVKHAVIQLEKFNVISPAVVEGSPWLGYKLNDNYKDGLKLQASISKRHMVRKQVHKPVEKPAKIIEPTYGPFNQVGESARLQFLLDDLLAKPRAKRIKRGLAV
ncbi:hypothetical protein [Providencia alcalifaciens]|uniref:hypothetical protein n=1 Tax=Providencia alcalifaciens TaxID=126385 RepID=UPI002B05D9A0|nr:hypothetical protein [Providencia alcalifaciens]